MKKKFILLFFIILCSGLADAQDFYSQKIISCSGGGFHSLAIDETGTLWAWGGNTYGQLGNETNIKAFSPVIVKSGTKFKIAEAGGLHSFAIDDLGNLWGWGGNSYGQLGDGTSSDKSRPEQINIGTKFKLISMGGAHSLAIDEAGNLWTWGLNASGQLGNGTTQNNAVPKQILSGTKFKIVSAGDSHSMAIDESGNLWTWGLNTSNQLGDGTLLNKTVPNKIMAGTKFKTVAAGVYHSLAIDESGNLLSFGRHTFLGTKITDLSVYKVENVKPGTKFSDISAGESHSLGIDETGQLWVWGGNSNGQLGDGTTIGKYEAPITILTGKKYNFISTGYTHSMAIDNAHNLWVWGINRDGQLGDGSVWDVSIPSQIMIGKKFYTITASSYSAFTIDETGDLWLLGQDYDLTSSTIPKNKFVGYGIKFDTISGVNNSLAIDINGNLWAWGSNYYGQVGDGTTNNKTTPVKIMSGTKFKSVAAGNSYSLAIDEFGQLWAWGYNSAGNLGDGTTLNKSIPVRIMSGTKYKIISASERENHSLAIDENGNLWAWGNNGNGQLGNGTTESKSSPVQIMAGIKFKTVSAGSESNSMAIDDSGTLWAWGGNEFGNLGDGTKIDRWTPVKIKSDTKFKFVSCGSWQAMAIDESGSLWSWGDNGYGQIGDGTFVDKQLPIQIKSGTKFNTIYSGHVYSMAIDVSGNLYVWGRNDYGQLGNGTAAWRENPFSLNNNIPVAIMELPINVEISVYSANNQIIVQAKDSEIFNIYNLLGSKVATGRLQSGETIIPVNSGFYIFSTKNYISKLFVK